MAYLKQNTMEEFSKDYLRTFIGKGDDFSPIDLLAEIVQKTRVFDIKKYNEIVKDGRLNYALRELYFWQYGNNDNFNVMLYRLLAKADSTNFPKLSQGFLEFAVAFCLWQYAEDQTKFFQKYTQ